MITAINHALVKYNVYNQIYTHVYIVGRISMVVDTWNIDYNISEESMVTYLFYLIFLLLAMRIEPLTLLLQFDIMPALYHCAMIDLAHDVFIIG